MCLQLAQQVAEHLSSLMGFNPLSRLMCLQLDADEAGPDRVYGFQSPFEADVFATWTAAAMAETPAQFQSPFEADVFATSE